MELLFSVFLAVGGGAIALHLFIIGKALWYLKVTFPRQLRPYFKGKEETIFKEKPPVLVFIPCKGITEDFENNIEMMLRQKYIRYEIIYVTESMNDPAARVLSGHALKHSNLHHIIAGETTSCCQKNHNLLKGIDYASRNQLPGEIYVFADGDMCPDTHWLENMILPLADHEVFAVSGFRRLLPKQKSFAGLQHAVFNAFLGMAIIDNRYAGMWGGSMALSRQMFEKYQVYQKWSTAMVDDTSLTWIIKKHNLVRIFSPDCIVYSREAYDTRKRVIDWFIRQTQYGANYLRRYVGFGILVNTMIAFVVWSLPVSVFLAFFQIVSWDVVGYHVCLFVLSIISFTLLMDFNRFNCTFLKWILYVPFFLLFGVYCGWTGFLSKRVIWANIVYHVNRNGEVLKVER
ncbi:MAG: glycosyltransferase family 2 protein [Candidatus Brocadiaceae bacterium]|nr:glycosyltransferase family 2 protein [Candidatus Brocadiaceae bacterium]